jgi:DoxX-like family
MTHTSTLAPDPISVPPAERRAYWACIGLFCVTFIVSALLTVLDPEGTRTAAVRLGFPTYIAGVPLAVAKLLGVVVVLRRFPATLKHFAYAGFLFDILLALAAHVHEGDFPAGWLAVWGLGLWIATFVLEQRRTAAGW